MMKRKNSTTEENISKKRKSMCNDKQAEKKKKVVLNTKCTVKKGPNDELIKGRSRPSSEKRVTKRKGKDNMPSSTVSGAPSIKRFICQSDMTKSATLIKETIESVIKAYRRSPTPPPKKMNSRELEDITLISTPTSTELIDHGALDSYFQSESNDISESYLADIISYLPPDILNVDEQSSIDKPLTPADSEELDYEFTDDIPEFLDKNIHADVYQMIEGDLFLSSSPSSIGNSLLSNNDKSSYNVFMENGQSPKKTTPECSFKMSHDHLKSVPSTVKAKHKSGTLPEVNCTETSPATKNISKEVPEQSSVTSFLSPPPSVDNEGLSSDSDWGMFATNKTKHITRTKSVSSHTSSTKSSSSQKSTQRRGMQMSPTKSHSTSPMLSEAIKPCSISLIQVESSLRKPGLQEEGTSMPELLDNLNLNKIDSNIKALSNEDKTKEYELGKCNSTDPKIEECFIRKYKVVLTKLNTSSQKQSERKQYSLKPSINIDKREFEEHMQTNKRYIKPEATTLGRATINTDHNPPISHKQEIPPAYTPKKIIKSPPKSPGRSVSYIPNEIFTSSVVVLEKLPEIRSSLSTEPSVEQTPQIRDRETTGQILNGEMTKFDGSHLVCSVDRHKTGNILNKNNKLLKPVSRISNDKIQPRLKLLTNKRPKLSLSDIKQSSKTFSVQLNKCLNPESEGNKLTKLAVTEEVLSKPVVGKAGRKNIIITKKVDKKTPDSISLCSVNSNKGSPKNSQKQSICLDRLNISQPVQMSRGNVIFKKPTFEISSAKPAKELLTTGNKSTGNKCVTVKEAATSKHVTVKEAATSKHVTVKEAAENRHERVKKVFASPPKSSPRFSTFSEPMTGCSLVEDDETSSVISLMVNPLLKSFVEGNTDDEDDDDDDKPETKSWSFKRNKSRFDCSEDEGNRSSEKADTSTWHDSRNPIEEWISNNNQWDSGRAEDPYLFQQELKGTALDGYCLQYLRTSRKGCCNLRHEEPYSLSRKDNWPRYNGKIPMAIKKVIEHGFNNPPVSVLQVFVLYCIQSQNHPLLICIATALKDNITFNENNKKTVEKYWFHFLEIITKKKSKENEKDNRHTIINNILKDVFANTGEVDDEGWKILCIILDILGTLGKTYSSFQILNSVEFLNTIMDLKKLPVSFIIAVTYQVVSASMSPQATYVPRFAYKVYKMLYLGISRDYEVYKQHQNLIDEFYKILNKNYSIENPFQTFGLKKHGSRSSSLSGRNNDHPIVGSKYHQELRQVIKRNINEKCPVAIKNALESCELTYPQLKEIYAAYSQYRNGDMHYLSLLRRCSDDIRNKLNSVTVSLMLKLAYEMNWHDAHSVFEEIKSVPFASIRLQGSFEELSPAKVVLITTKVCLKFKDIKNAINLFIDHKMYNCDEWKNEPMWHEICEELKKTCIVMYHSDDLYIGLSQIVEVQETLRYPLDIATAFSKNITKQLSSGKRLEAASLVRQAISSIPKADSFILESVEQYRTIIIQLVKNKDVVGAKSILYKFRFEMEESSDYFKHAEEEEEIVLRSSLSKEEMYVIVLIVGDYISQLTIRFQEDRTLSDIIPEVSGVDCSVQSAIDRFTQSLRMNWPLASVIRKGPNCVAIDRITIMPEELN